MDDNVRTSREQGPPAGVIGRKEFEARVIQRAWQDPQFKQELMSNPKGTLERELRGINDRLRVGENVTVNVVEETADTIYLVLPRNPGDTPRRQVTERETDEASAALWPRIVDPWAFVFMLF